MLGDIVHLIFVTIPIIVLLFLKGKMQDKKYPIILLIISASNLISFFRIMSYINYYHWFAILELIAIIILYSILAILMLMKKKTKAYMVLTGLLCVLQVIQTIIWKRYLICLISLVLFGLCVYLSYKVSEDDDIKELSKYEWIKYIYLAAIILGSSNDYLQINFVSNIPFISNISNIKFISIIIMLGLINIDSKEEKKEIERRISNSDGYYSLGLHILFLFITFGIYQLIWIHRVTEFTNRDESKEYRNPTKKLLLCMFVPFYQIYWMYQTGVRVDNIFRKENKYSNIASTSLILAIFIPIVAPIIIQNKINELREPMAFNNNFVNNNSTNNNNLVNENNAADTLVKYKELLDSGAITKEEYETLKQKILNKVD